MKIMPRNLAAATAALLAAVTPAAAWTGSAAAGPWRFTAAIGPAHALQLGVAGADPSTPLDVRAWFVDADGLILGSAAEARLQPGAPLQIAAAGVAVPPEASALVVLARPEPAAEDAATPPETVAQIALPASLR